MPKAKLEKPREKRIQDEILVDAYTAEEQALGWYVYLEGKLHFPFPARCIAPRPISPLRKGQEVEVVGQPPDEECYHEMFVTIVWEDRTLAVPLAQLEPIRADKTTRQAIEDWHYWLRQGYEFLGTPWG
jgi:Calcium binding